MFYQINTHAPPKTLSIVAPTDTGPEVFPTYKNRG